MEEELRAKLLYQVSAGIIGDIVIKGILGSCAEGDFIIETRFEKREIGESDRRLREFLAVSVGTGRLEGGQHGAEGQFGPFGHEDFEMDMVRHHDAIKNAQAVIVEAKLIEALMDDPSGGMDFHEGRDFFGFGIAGNGGEERGLRRFQHSDHIDAAAAVVVALAPAIEAMMKILHENYKFTQEFMQAKACSQNQGRGGKLSAGSM